MERRFDVTDIQNPGLITTQPFQPGTSVDVNTLDYGFSFGLIFAGATDTEATKAKLDLSREFEFFGNTTEVKFGGQFDTREANGGSTLAQDFAGLAGVDLNSFVTNPGMGQRFQQYDRWPELQPAGHSFSLGSECGRPQCYI